MREIAWFTAGGVNVKKAKWRKENIHAFSLFLDGHAVFGRTTWGEREEDDSFLLLFNGSGEQIEFALPGSPWAASYVQAIDTFEAQIGATDTTAPPSWKAHEQIGLKPWSVVVLRASVCQSLNQSVP
jgi:isoamylase